MESKQYCKKKIQPLFNLKIWLTYTFITYINNLFLKNFYKKFIKLSKNLIFFKNLFKNNLLMYILIKDIS